MSASILRMGAQGAIGGAVVGATVGVAVCMWKRGREDSSVVQSSLTDMIRRAGLTADAEDAVDTLVSVCPGNVGSVRALVAKLGALASVASRPIPDAAHPRRHVAPCVEAAGLVRGCRDILTTLEVCAGKHAEFGPSAEALEKYIGDLVFNINVGTGTA